MAYEFAVNKAKLQQAIDAVRVSGKPVNEENVKENYILRAGLLQEEKEINDKIMRPKVTAAGGRKISAKGQ